MAEADKKEAGEPAEAVAAAPAKKSKTLLIIVGAVVLVLVLAGGAFAFITLSKKKVQTEQLDADAAQSEAHPGSVPEASLDEDELIEGEEPLGGILPLDTFVVNLKGGKYIRAQIQFEFAEREVPRRIYPRLVIIRDQIISIFAGKSADDLLTDTGRDQLKSDVRDAVNTTLHKEDVKRVYFTQFVVQ